MLDRDEAQVRKIKGLRREREGRRLAAFHRETNYREITKPQE
jgi:hypothetical protein